MFHATEKKRKGSDMITTFKKTLETKFSKKSYINLSKLLVKGLRSIPSYFGSFACIDGHSQWKASLQWTEF